MENTTLVGPVENIYGDNLTVTCKAGYKIHNGPNSYISLTLACPENGEWPEFPGCEKKGLLKKTMCFSINPPAYMYLPVCLPSYLMS